MTGKLLASLVVLFSLGCAEPRYEIVNSEANPGETLGQAAEADCTVRFNVSGHCLSWKWEKKPTASESGTLVFKTYRPNLFDGTPVQVDADVALILWMPSMGHGSAPTTVSRLDVGTYRADEVYFIMPGEWDLRFQIISENAVKDEAVVQIVF